MTAYTIYAGDAPSECMTIDIVCSRECAEAWLDEHAPFDGGYERIDVEAGGLCSQCGWFFP
jgi:hypothetical protein